MPRDRIRALSEVLDQLESSARGSSITVEEVVEKLGRKSFAAVMLIFSLISASPASAIPGLTTTVATIVAVLVVQMLLGRECLWLPKFLNRRRLATATLCRGISWLRKPVHRLEGFLRVRLTFLLRRPWLHLPLVLVLMLTMVMPIMEVIPGTGSVASAVIALFAAGLLTRDGALVLAALAVLGLVPLTLWRFGFIA